MAYIHILYVTMMYHIKSLTSYNDVCNDECMSTLTATYPFTALAVGNYFTVEEQFQHARVAASEYGRKHGQCYSCRKQQDGTMRVYRVNVDQRSVDQRGRRGKRRIDVSIPMPTEEQFYSWLATFMPTMSYVMPATYRQHYLLMQAWTSLYAIRNRQEWHCGMTSNQELMINRSK